MTRSIITIDEAKCNGCGLCIPDCAEGALQIIDGKARLVSDLFCDGLGACLGRCPQGAIAIEVREAAPYQEQKKTPVHPQANAISIGMLISPKLNQWPIQMHLINPTQPYFVGSNFLLAADCTAFALGSFHPQLLAGKKLGIACPKLDGNKELYLEKLIALIDNARIDTLTVAIMEVPCCGGLQALALQAAALSERKVPIKLIVVGTQGGIVSEKWL